MNAIDHALRVISQQIPREVLEKAFIPLVSYQTRIPVTVDSRIRELVINNRVLPDINIIGGTHITIPLSGLPFEPVEANAFVVRVPKERTQGRSIVSALSLAIGGVATEGMIANPLSSVPDSMSATQQMLNSLASIPYVSEAQLSMLADNVVLIQGLTTMPQGLWLRCEVENDSNLNNLKRRSYFAFSKLCVLACKSWIYNNTVIPMGNAYYEGGINLGKLADVIEGYSDAEEQYEEFLLTKWAKVSKLNDAETAERLVRLTTGGNY